MLNTNDYIVSACDRIMQDATGSSEEIMSRLRDLCHTLRSVFSARVDRDLRGVADGMHDILTMPQMDNLPAKMQCHVRSILLQIFADVAAAHATLVLPQKSWIQPPHTGTQRSRPTQNPDRSGKSLTERLEQHVRLAAMVGMEEALRTLEAMGVLGDQEHAPAMRILRRYLGRSKAPERGDRECSTLPQGSALEKSPVVYEETRLGLLRGIYEECLRLGFDATIHEKDTQKNIDSTIQEYIEKLIRASGGTADDFKALSGDVVATFRAATQYQPPPSWVTTLDMNEVSTTFPSLRQRLALQEFLRKKHGILTFAPGMGKTAVPLMLYHHLLENQQATSPKPRMLFVGPKGPNQQLPNYIRPGSAPGTVHHQYYKSDVPMDQRPTIGRISADMSNDQLRDALTRDIVFVDDTMLSSQRENHTITDLLAACNPPFTIAVIDECHRAKGGGPVTQNLRTLFDHIPNLRKEGYCIGISATPSPNTLVDLLEIQSVIDPPPADLSSSAALRRARRGLVAFDRRNASSWEDRMREPTTYSLNQDTQLRIRRIVMDNTLEARTKITAMQRIIFASPEFRQSLREKILAALNNGARSILIATHHIAEGVTRSGEGKNGSSDVWEDIEGWCKDWSEENDQPVYFNSIDGANNAREEQRQQIFQKGEECIRGKNRRNIILVNAACIQLGRDLRGAVDAVVCTGWPYCEGEMEQLVGRWRGQDIPIETIYAAGTIEEAIKYWADMKQQVVSRFLGYDRMTDDQLSQSLSAQAEPEHDERIIERMTSLAERAFQARWLLDGRGLTSVRRWWSTKRRRRLSKESMQHPEESGEGNIARYIAAHTNAVIENTSAQSKILHVYGQGMHLARSLIESGQECDITSIELCAHTIAAGLAKIQTEQKPKHFCGKLHEITRASEDHNLREMDAVILEGLEYTRHGDPNGASAQPPTDSEREKTITAAISALKNGGILTIHIRHDACSDKEFALLAHVLQSRGLTIQKKYSGTASSQDNEEDPPFEMRTITAIKGIREPDQATRALLPPFVTAATSDPGGKKNQRKIKRRILPHPLSHCSFRIGSQEFNYPGNESLQKAMEEQRKCIRTIKNAMQQIRKVARNVKAYQQKTEAEKINIMAEAGVEPHPDLHLESRPSFFHPDWPEITLYPYDPQWEDPKS